jgi:hypothetical protein
LLRKNARAQPVKRAFSPVGAICWFFFVLSDLGSFPCSLSAKMHPHGPPRKSLAILPGQSFYFFASTIQSTVRCNVSVDPKIVEELFIEKVRPSRTLSINELLMNFWASS